MKRVGVTGSTGFVGKRLMQYNKERFLLLPLDLRNTDMGSMDLRGMDAIVHLAGKAHQMTPIDDQIYYDVNYEITKKLARAAIEQHVPHFIYVSSTKVYGDDIKEKLNEQSACSPSDAYGVSKLKAERCLQELESDDFKIAIVRPPLVYGPEVKGNMIKLLALAKKKYPLPFGNTANARSMVYVDNLIELINVIIDKKATGIFIAGDVAPVSTSQLISLIRKSFGKSSSLISIPGFIRNLVRQLKPAFYNRLFGSFVVDNSDTNRRLNFKPPYTTEDGVKQMVNWFQQTTGSNR
jgi:nucleoside-diphosphate-sugar epimerase